MTHNYCRQQLANFLIFFTKAEHSTNNVDTLSVVLGIILQDWYLINNRYTEQRVGIIQIHTQIQDCFLWFLMDLINTFGSFSLITWERSMA